LARSKTNGNYGKRKQEHRPPNPCRDHVYHAHRIQDEWGSVLRAKEDELDDTSDEERGAQLHNDENHIGSLTLEEKKNAELHYSEASECYEAPFFLFGHHP